MSERTMIRKFSLGLTFSRQRGLLASLAVVITLVSIFGLSNWAELTLWHHAVQHVLIFGGGLSFGAAWTLNNKKETR